MPQSAGVRTPRAHSPEQRLRVVVFSGGRGSGVLSQSLIRDPRIDLSIAINGYDDGASTGEVRRFLGDALGPSDFRKNASRLAAALGSCSEALLSLLDWRLPDTAGAGDAEDIIGSIRGAIAPAYDAVAMALSAMSKPERLRVSERLDRFERERQQSGRPFNFADCSLGNLVFAGSFLLAKRDFNAAVDDYCGIVGLPAGVIENVTDGANAFLVGEDADGRIIATEEELVDPARARSVRDIFLTDRRPAPDEDVRTFVARHGVTPAINPRFAAKLEAADLIIYAPGTQHSSLFPSYLTAGLTGIIAANLRAIKLLVTNIQTDAEIVGQSAVDLIERAVYYLKNKGQMPLPTPALITHYVLNDPAHAEPDRPYVPLGQVELLEDPRLVRIANYEDGVSGRHDATRILTPFIESLLAAPARPRIAVLLHDAGSINKVAQSIIEMVRGGIERAAADVTVLYAQREALDAAFVASLPVQVTWLGSGGEADHRLRAELQARFDHVVLFESSGMYRGEDVVSLCSHLSLGRLDAVWGSRRLSVRDIQESYRLRYQHSPVLGWVSYLGSHVLSVMYLFLYGRYIADTLSAVRAVPVADALDLPVPLTHKRANHWLLVRLLTRKADVLEVPVRFVPLSPELVKRTTVGEGLGALWTIVRERFRSRPKPTNA